MMQPCASAARLLGGGPILSLGMEAMGAGGSPPPRIVLALHRVEPDERRTCRTLVFAPTLLRPNRSYRCRTQLGARRHLAGRHVAPQRDQQLAGQSHDHGFADIAAGA